MKLLKSLNEAKQALDDTRELDTDIDSQEFYEGFFRNLLSRGKKGKKGKKDKKEGKDTDYIHDHFRRKKNAESKTYGGVNGSGKLAPSKKMTNAERIEKNKNARNITGGSDD